MGADWGPIFSGIIIAICLIIAIPFIDIEETDGTYKEEILQESFTKKYRGSHIRLYWLDRSMNQQFSIENWSFWKLEKIKIPNLKLDENSIFNQTEETIENSEIEQIQSKLDEPKIELPIDESPKLLFKPGKIVVFMPIQ